MTLCRFCLTGMLLLCTQVIAEPLPQPLTLQQAMGFAASDHPQYRLQRAKQTQREAQLLTTLSDQNLEAHFIADGRLVEPSTNTPRVSRNDSRLHLTVSKRLYDFGQSKAETTVAETRLASEQQRLAYVVQQRRLEIMRDFLDVLLADRAYAVGDEAMAIEFVRLDRLRQRNKLSQRSDIALAEQETLYQKQRGIRYRAEAQQRITRARLAESMNRPDDLAADLVAPVSQLVGRELPELDLLVKQAMENNLLLLVLHQEAAADQQQMQLARKSGRPVLSGELTASDYAREFTTRDKLRAGLLLDVPLYTGGRVKARRAEAIALLHETQAKLAQTKSEIRLSLREAVEQLGVLRVKHEEALAEQTFRDLDLDRSRTNYELEFASDLGNTMADSTAAGLKRMQAEFQMLLTWAEIALLTGHAEWDPVTASDKAISDP